MTGLEIALVGLGGADFLASIFGSSKSHSEQKKAEAATKEEKIRAYEFNIGQTEKDIERIGYVSQETRAEIRREGGQFMRGQAAAAGAAGARVGVGSPLMAMTETAESIERDILRIKRLAQMETEKKEAEIGFMEQEIEELSSTTFKKKHKEFEKFWKEGPPWTPLKHK